MIGGVAVEVDAVDGEPADESGAEADVEPALPVDEVVDGGIDEVVDGGVDEVVGEIGGGPEGVEVGGPAVGDRGEVAGEVVVGAVAAGDADGAAAGPVGRGVASGPGGRRVRTARSAASHDIGHRLPQRGAGRGRVDKAAGDV